MAGWIPMPADGWSETAALLTATGKPWPRSAVVFDLRWHADQKVAVPGRGGLSERWGWSDREVRKLLAAPGIWWDAAKGPPPTDRAELDEYIGASVPGVRRSNVPVRTQLRTSSYPAPHQPVPSSTTANADNGDGSSQPVPSSVPAPSQLRTSSVHRAIDGGSQPQPPTQPPAHEQGASPLDPIHLGADPALSVTDGLLFHHRPSEAVQPPQATTDLALVPPKAPRAKPAPAKGIADPSVARVWEVYRSHHPRAGEVPPKPWPVAEAVTSEGVEAMLLVIEWAHTSEDPGAVQLREGGYLGETLFRPSKRGRYIELSAAWRARGRLAAPITTGRTISPAAADALDWARNTLAPQRDVIDVVNNTEEQRWIR